MSCSGVVRQSLPWALSSHGNRLGVTQSYAVSQGSLEVWTVEYNECDEYCSTKTIKYIPVARESSQLQYMYSDCSMRSPVRLIR